jgi:hypothetical protein
MNGYTEFVEQLDKHLKGYKTQHRESWVTNSLRFVDGLAAEELRRLVDLEKRREFGAFFTDSDMAFDLLSNPTLKFGENCTVYDPAVGAGNLLIAAFKAIRPGAKLTLLGTDLHQEFIAAAKLRLELLTLLTYTESQPFDLLKSDGLQDNEFYKRATHIVTNPPFHLMNGEDDIEWGKGKVSVAAVFIDRIIRYVSPGTTIIAILPDVLRSGSRYAKWRLMVEKFCNVRDLKMLGQFDKYADIDVFSVILSKKRIPKTACVENFWTNESISDCIVGDFFEVSVGSVVDNRDPHEGPLRPYLVSRGLPGWQMISTIDRKRQFGGKSISGPFVVVKRTSRMGDKHRAVASIINVPMPVYVDNHLIVLIPKLGRIEDCRSLLRKLEREITDSWLDEQIRCRHLTVKIVTRIPL